MNIKNTEHQKEKQDDQIPLIELEKFDHPVECTEFLYAKFEPLDFEYNIKT